MKGGGGPKEKPTEIGGDQKKRQTKEKLGGKTGEGKSALLNVG